MVLTNRMTEMNTIACYTSNTHVDWDRNSDIDKRIADMVSADINLDKAQNRCSFSAFQMVLQMLKADPNRRQKMQKFEKDKMALKFALNKFGLKFLSSGICLSLYLRSSEVTAICKNANAKIFGLFGRIGRYYDTCLEDDNILSFLNNGDLGKEFESYVSTHVTCNTMEEVITVINNEKAVRIIERAQQRAELENKAASSYLFDFFRGTSPSSTNAPNCLRTLLLNDSTQIEEMDLDSEEIGFTNDTKYSCLQMPFTSEQTKILFENNTSRIIEANTKRYKIE